MFCPRYAQRGPPLRRLTTTNPPMPGLSVSCLSSTRFGRGTKKSTRRKEDPSSNTLGHPYASPRLSHERDSPIGRTKMPPRCPTGAIPCNTLLNWRKEMANDLLPWAVGPTDRQACDEVGWYATERSSQQPLQT